MKNENKNQKLLKWEFHVHVEMLSGYCVDNTIIKEVSEEEYRLLEEGRNMHLELKFNAKLADIYEDVWLDAFEQEEKRCENREEYLEVDADDFWEECSIEINY